MGQIKKMLEEYEEAESVGVLLPQADERYLCANHYKDKYLQAIITKGGSEGRCSYCGRNHVVTDLRNFVEDIHGRIFRYYNSVEKEDLPTANEVFDGDEQENQETEKYFMRVGNGNYAVFNGTETYDNNEELFYHIDLCSDNINLDRDVKACFFEHEWIRRDSFASEENEIFLYSWKKFAASKIEGKPIVVSKGDWGEDRWIKEEAKCIVESIGKMAVLYGMCRTIPVGSIIYRARNVDKKEDVRSFEDITSPDKKYASVNRMSKGGVSMFYGAFSKEIPLKECIKNGKPILALGEFETTQALHVLDLSYLPELSFWMDGWQECIFLRNFHHEVTKPIADSDKQREYIPTQIFTEYIRDYLLDSEGNRMNGIVYKSSKSSENNIVLFYDKEDSNRVLKLNRVEYN